MICSNVFRSAQLRTQKILKILMLLDWLKYSSAARTAQCCCFLIYFSFTIFAFKYRINRLGISFGVSSFSLYSNIQQLVNTQMSFVSLVASPFARTSSTVVSTVESQKKVWPTPWVQTVFWVASKSDIRLRQSPKVLRPPNWKQRGWISADGSHTSFCLPIVVRLAKPKTFSEKTFQTKKYLLSTNRKEL